MQKLQEDEICKHQKVDAPIGSITNSWNDQSHHLPDIRQPLSSFLERALPLRFLFTFTLALAWNHMLARKRFRSTNNLPQCKPCNKQILQFQIKNIEIRNRKLVQVNAGIQRRTVDSKSHKLLPNTWRSAWATSDGLLQSENPCDPLRSLNHWMPLS